MSVGRFWFSEWRSQHISPPLRASLMGQWCTNYLWTWLLEKRIYDFFFFFGLFVCLFPLCEGFPKMRNTAILLPPPPPPQKRVALYYVKFSMTGWKLISTLNKCADLWFWSNKHKALGDQGKVERKWNKLFLRIQANALPLCQALFLLFFFSHNASDALWLGLCLNWAEAHTQIIFS